MIDDDFMFMITIIIPYNKLIEGPVLYRDGGVRPGECPTSHCQMGAGWTQWMVVATTNAQ